MYLVLNLLIRPKLESNISTTDFQIGIEYLFRRPQLFILPYRTSANGKQVSDSSILLSELSLYLESIFLGDWT